MDSIDSSHEPVTFHPPDGVSEDTQELLSPRERADGVFDDRPILVSDEDEEDQETRPSFRDTRGGHDTPNTVHFFSERQDKAKRSRLDKQNDNNPDDTVMTHEHPNYVSASSGDEADDDADDSDREISAVRLALDLQQLSMLSPPLRRSHTPPDALLPTQGRVKSDGHHHFLHIFHDELSTLYEEPNKSGDMEEDDDDDRMAQVQETSLVHSGFALDESNIRARWDYALQLMARVGQCEPSDIYNSIADLMSANLVTNGEVETGEI